MSGLVAPWQRLPLLERIRWLRYVLPPFFAGIVIIYQLFVALPLEESYGHFFHYSFEIAFYSLTGPVVTWLTLKWVERSLADKEALEHQVRARTQMLASLTEASADAILSLDPEGMVASWNRGARDIFEYPQPEVIGRPVGELLPKAATMQEQLQQAGELKDFETVAVTRSGKQIYVELTQTIQDGYETGSPGSLIILRDITLRREREAIIEEERARIARDLHDGMAQNLYFMALKADKARQQTGKAQRALAQELGELSRAARQVIREVRRTIYALRPLDWSRGGFIPALREFVEGYAEQLGWQVEFDTSELRTEIPSRYEPAIFRLVQESLNNVAKHAEAGHVLVELSSAPGQLDLKIVDDGRGLNQDHDTGRGLGLGQMRTRTEALGGEFHFASETGVGTTTFARFPLAGDYP